LLHRERTGHADVVDVSLLGTGVWAMGAAVAMSLQSGSPWRPPPRNPAMVRNPLTGNFRTSDGRWINFTMLQAFKYWPEVCRVIGREEFVTDPRFATHEDLTTNAAAAQAIVTEAIASASFDDWRKRLSSDFVGQWAPVQDTIEVAEDPQVVANGYVLETHTKDGRPFKLATTPVQFNEEPSVPRRAPEFNEHGDDILSQELGIDWDTIVELKVKGVVA
jgi:crotonobetainyl-CoA:carnitine CoA-transferase CaiB-like acyl-CoA transferase